MWATGLIWLIVIWNKGEGRYFTTSDKGHAVEAEDEEFSRLEKRQRITGELEISGQKFESLGCWRDAWARGLPTLEGEHYLLMEPNYKGRKHALLKCARAALDKKFKVFGIENGGQCFASADGEKKYQKYGASKNCKGDGKGGPWSLQVYRFTESKGEPIDGKYSRWSEWTKCSRMCGGGVRRRMRKCSNPAPLNGGQDCRRQGPSIESQDCNAKPCSAKFALGTPEFHGVSVSATRKRGGQVPQRMDAENQRQQQPTHVMHSSYETLPEHNVENQHLDYSTNQREQPNSHDQEETSEHENKYVPMSKEDLMSYGQISSFQNSHSKPQLTEPMKAEVENKGEDKGEDAPNTEETSSENRFPTQSSSLHEDPDMKEHPEHLIGNLNKPVAESTPSEDGRDFGFSQDTDLHGFPQNNIESGAGEVNHPHDNKSLSHAQGHGENGDSDLSNEPESRKGTDGGVTDSAMMSSSNVGSPNFPSNDISGHDNLHNGVGFTKTGESLKFGKPVDIEHTQGREGSQDHNMKQSSPMNKPKTPFNDLQYGKGAGMELSIEQSHLGGHQLEVTDSPQNTAANESDKVTSPSEQGTSSAVYGTKVIVGESESSASPPEQSHSSNQDTFTAVTEKAVHNQENSSDDMKSSAADLAVANPTKEEERPLRGGALASPQGKEMKFQYNSNSSEVHDWSMNQRFSKPENQLLIQKPNRVAAMSEQHNTGNRSNERLVLATQYDQNQPSAKGEGSSINGQGSTENGNSQEVHGYPKLDYKTNSLSSKQAPKLNDEKSSNKGGKANPSDKGKGSFKEENVNPLDEEEPVPIVDVFNGGGPNAADVEPTNGDRFSGPGEEPGSQGNSMPNSQDPSMGNRPEYDNEAIQGISEDQNIMQQVDSSNPDEMASPAMPEYDDAGFSYAYTGENSSGRISEQMIQDKKGINENQERLEHKGAKPFSSSGTEDESAEREEAKPVGGTHQQPAVDYYDTADCICPKKECSAKADIAFLVDGSSSIPQPYYARVLEFVKILSRGLEKTNTHVGLMAFGDTVKIARSLTELRDFKQFDEAVNTAPYIGGRARTGNALTLLKTSLFALFGRQDAPRAVILMSSGGSTDDVVSPAEELRDSGVKVTSIGLGKQANVRELINVASEPKSEHVFTAFLDTLPNTMDDIIQSVCRDVMGIIRDRQEPCTCESYNSDLQAINTEHSQNMSSELQSDNGLKSGKNLVQNHYQQRKETEKAVSNNENQTAPYSMDHQYVEANEHSGQYFKLTDGNKRLDWHESQSRGPFQETGVHNRVGMNGLHKDMNRGPPAVMQHPFNPYSKSTEEHEHNRIQGEHIFGQKFEYPKGNYLFKAPETENYESDLHVNGTQNDLSQESSSQEKLRRPEEHTFTFGTPEHYRPLAGNNQNNAAEGKLTVKETYADKVNETSLQGNKQFGREKQRENSLPWGHRVQGIGGHQNPSFNHEKVTKEPRVPFDTLPSVQDNFSPDTKQQTKVMVVGKAVDNSSGGQHKRNECAGVNLGVVLDSAATAETFRRVQRKRTINRKMMDLAKEISHLFPVSTEGNRVGMVLFGGSPQPSVVHFDKFLDQKSMDQAIDNASSPSLEIRIGKALALAQRHLFSRLPSSKRNVLLLVTDGSSSDDVMRPAIELKRRGIEVFCLGVGNRINKEQLSVIASEPDDSHVFLAPLNDPTALLETVQKEICEASSSVVGQHSHRKCPSDIGFVIDGSRSVEVLGKGNFKEMLQFVKNVTLGFHVSPEDTRVAAIVYGTEPKLVIPFNKYTGPKGLGYAIETITYPGTATMTGKALDLANQKMFDKESRVNVPKVLVVLTEGTSRDNVTSSSQALHRAGVTVISMGVGPVYNANQLNHVASSPTADHIITAKFNQLRHKVTELQDKICMAKKRLVQIK